MNLVKKWLISGFNISDLTFLVKGSVLAFILSLSIESSTSIHQNHTKMSITCSQALSVDRSSLKEERFLEHNPEMRSWLHDKDYQEKKL